MPVHIHILGICGTFMGGIAAIAKAAGFRVTGCDANVYPPMSEQLAALGIELVQGFGSEQVRLRPDLWVVGNVVARGNPLMEAILDRGERYLSGPQWLAEQVLAGREVIAVAGTHGKTTTASMLAWILERAGRSPGYLIGGVPNDFAGSARLTNSKLFVIEADEYDTAFFDKRSKFVHYRSRTAILNNLEFDHADIFSDLAAIERQFHHLVRTVPGNGLLVVNDRDPALRRVLAMGCWTPIERFGSPGNWEAGASDEDGHFDIARSGRTLGRVRWNLLGTHNQLNAIASAAAACHAGVEPAAVLDALSSFSGVRRRMEMRGRADGVTVYDDFAHHPTAVRTTLEGLRRKVGAQRVLAVLEPRSNTMRQGVLKDELVASVQAADRVFVFGAGLGWDATQVFAALGSKARCFDELNRLAQAVADEARPGDHVLVMSNGSFGGVHDTILGLLRGRPAAEASRGGRR